MKYKIYLHWTATNYNWAEPGHYHIVIGNKGKITRLHPNTNVLAHTFGRNTGAIGIAIACMGGTVWKDFPPQKEQIEALCQVTVKLMKEMGYKKEELTIQNVMTHAEAAANRDFPLDLARRVSGKRPISSVQVNQFDAEAKKLGMPHANYGPTHWHDNWPGGWAERWDLAQLKQNDQMGIGGFRLRQRMLELWT